METLTIKATSTFSGEEGLVRRGETLKVGEARGKQLIERGLAEEAKETADTKDATVVKPKAKVVTSKPGQDREVKPEASKPETK